MSGRSHVDVSERRLRPIYDCLDNGNNKKAIQEADKVLKKQKDLLCAKALKALALHRLGRQDESITLLQDVHSQSPTDDASLQAMAICYREMHKLELIADMYENASKAKPSSEEILSALFMAYVRLGDYKKQQQTAMALHRTRPQKNPYYFWAVMSIVMQSYDAKENLAQAMFLPLAERMTSKYIQDNKIQAEAEVQLYLIILESQGKYEEALKTLQGSMGERLVSEPLFIEKKSADYNSKLKKWPNVNAIYRALLVENIDHWDFYKHYFMSAFQVIDAKWSPSEEDSVLGVVDNSLEKLVTFVLEQKGKASTLVHLPRGPYLAELLLIKELRSRTLPVDEKLGDPVELLKSYFSTFGDKLCCYGDMKGFLELLKREQQIKFVEDLCNETGVGKVDDGISLAKDNKSMQRHLCLLQLSSYCGLHQQLEISSQMSLVNEMLQRYDHGLEFGKGILSTDLQPCDNYLLLAAHILINIWNKTGDNKILWQTIGQLELGLKNSPSNFQMKIILIRLYATLGAFGPCVSIYESMEIKHIQHDTLGYIVSSHVERLGHFTTARSIHDAILKFFTINQKDTTEYLISSYKFGSFTKIREFVQFRERLQNSLQFAASRTDAMMLDLLHDTDSMRAVQQMARFIGLDPEKDEYTDWDNIEDNRDFDVITSWQPETATLSDELKLRSCKEEIAWIKLRDLTVRALCAALALTMKPCCEAEHCHDNHGTSNGHIAADGISVAKSLVGQLEDHVSSCQQTFLQPATYPLEGPFRTRLSTYLKLNLSEPLVEALQCLIYVYSSTEALEKPDPKVEEKLGKKLGQCVKDLVEAQTKVLREGDACRKSLEPDVIENLVLVAELLGQVATIAGVCHELIKTVKPQTKKGKKKKELSNSSAAVSNGIGEFIKSLTEAVKGLHGVVHETDVDFLSSSMAELKLYENAPEMALLTEEIKDQVTEKVLQSYQQTAKELLKFLSTKLQFLSTLH